VLHEMLAPSTIQKPFCEVIHSNETRFYKEAKKTISDRYNVEWADLVLNMLHTNPDSRFSSKDLLSKISSMK